MTTFTSDLPDDGSSSAAPVPASSSNEEHAPGPNDVIVAPGGDLVLVVGKVPVKIRVLSAVLKNTSRVFEAMLGPNFAEGAQLYLNAQNKNPVEITLPEDDAAAIGTICKILHCTPDAGNNPGDGQKLLDLANAADKYDLVERVSFSAKAWLMDLADSGDCPQLLLGLMAAYKLAVQPAFAALSCELITSCAGSCFNLKTAIPDIDVLACELIMALEQARSSIHAEIVEAVNASVTTTPISCCCPLDKQDRVGLWFPVLNSGRGTNCRTGAIRLVTLMPLSIHDLENDVDYFSHLGFDNATADRHRCSVNARPLLRENVPKAVDNLVASFPGLCFQCFSDADSYIGNATSCCRGHDN